MECSYCKKKIGFPDDFKCKFCEEMFCGEHIQLENHDCVKTAPTKYLRKDWLRKYELDISTGLYVVACDDCGFRSEIGRLIDIADDERKQHISTVGCDEKKVFLEQWK